MNFPVSIEDPESIFSIAKSTVDILSRLYHHLKELDDDGASENGDRKDCIREAILILHKETQTKKNSHVEKFVENTLLTPECEIEPSTLFSVLQDIEQMTWRQLCLLEGFRRKDSGRIEISGYDNSGITGISIGTEIKKLIHLNYLSRGSHDIHRDTSTRFEHISITLLGKEISTLLDLQSVEISEIAKVFGKGKIQETVRY